MPTESPNPADVPKDLPASTALVVTAGPAPQAASTPGPSTEIVVGQMPPKQLSELPRDELAHLAEDLGIDVTKYKNRQALVAAVHDRRQAIAGMDREAMLDVVRWGRRPVAFNATKEQIAQEIARIKSMRFAGLSHRGLIVLANLRGVPARIDDQAPLLIRRLKKQEGVFSKLNRKRRGMLGSIVSNLVGEAEPAADYQFLPPTPTATQDRPQPGPSASRPASIKEEIEDAGLFGGISNRIKKSADQYLNQKLDEIEARIDRKLDEIDRRLAEWRDKEIANRIRILKITLWASVIVGIFTLIYAYVKAYFIQQ